ncbi:hypothetical protein BC629DRAFT_1456655 [Irpex lacteus]|nr:hypothetical protein BC629DRAFT_1456655 [Irpex lacteus]
MRCVGRFYSTIFAYNHPPDPTVCTITASPLSLEFAHISCECRYSPIRRQTRHLPTAFLQRVC